MFVQIEGDIFQFGFRSISKRYKPELHIKFDYLTKGTNS